MQHHDTITGTSKAYVINNHVFKIEKALAANSQMLSITVKKRVEGLYPNLQFKSTPFHVYDFDKTMNLSPKTAGAT
jgi:ribosomal protein S6